MKANISVAGRVNLILLLILVVCVTASLSLRFAMPESYQKTTLWSTYQVLTLNYTDDSWYFLDRAFDSWRNGAAHVYADTFYQGEKFQYPPTAALLGYFPHWFDTQKPRLAYHLVSLAFFLATIFAADRIIMQRLGEPGGRLANTARLALVATLALAFYPIVRALYVGQVQMWIDGLFALALLGWVRGQRILPCVLIALICLIKPQLSLFLVWGVLRREWRFAAALVGAGAAGGLVSLWAFGLDDHLHYLKVLSFMAERGESFHANQSVNGVLNRILSLDDPVAYYNTWFNQVGFPPYHPMVRYGTLASTIVILSLALWPRARSTDEGRTFDFCIMALSATMASPIAWEHHYGIAFPIYALLVARFWGDRWRLAALGVSYFLVSTLLLFLNASAATPFNFLQSYLLAGAVILLVLLYLGPPRASRAGALPAKALSTAVA